VYSAEDELEIFTELFETALREKKKIHIIWMTLKEEIEMLEKYYTSLWFLREDINCFDVDFSVPLVTVSVNLENLMWKWSDYKKMKSDIFFIPPVRESSQNKAMFKWINRWVTAWIHITKFWNSEKQFLSEQIYNEKILPLTMGKVLFYNLDDAGVVEKSDDLEIQY
jgi:dihydroorotase-like cyclic amidohydrolase